MDDVDDILASVDRDDVSSPQATALDHQVLTRFWVAERAVPEVLPWPGKLMERAMERVKKQISVIEDLSLSADPASSPNLNLKLCILQSDLSRTQYLIRSLLRQRLAKLTKYSLHYLRLCAPEYAATSTQSQSQSQSQFQSQSQTQTQTPTPYERQQQPSSGGGGGGEVHDSLLSTQEVTFLRSHQSVLSGHYNASFLSAFPQSLKRLDDRVGTSSMVVAPDNKEIVFVRCLNERVKIVVPSPPRTGADGRMRQEVLGYGDTMRKGEVWVVRWEGVREGWENGDVEVL